METILVLVGIVVAIAYYKAKFRVITKVGETAGLSNKKAKTLATIVILNEGDK